VKEGGAASFEGTGEVDFQLNFSFGVHEDVIDGDVSGWLSEGFVLSDGVDQIVKNIP
jgi:hypothetical protein